MPRRDLLHWPCDHSLPPSKKRQAQACEGRAGGNRALARLRRPGAELLVRWTNRRVVTAGVARQSRALTASPMCAGPALPAPTGLKKAETRLDRRSTRVFAFPGRGGMSFCVCAAAPRQATKAGNQGSRNSYPGSRPQQSPARPKPRYNAKSRIDRRSTRVFAFSWRRSAAASNQGQKPV